MNLSRLNVARIPPQDRISIAVAINLLATPGLGTWIAGRRLTGTAQMILAGAGVTPVLLYLGTLVVRAYRAVLTGLEPEPAPTTLLKYGLALFAIAWIWAACSSLALWLESRRRESPPPRLN